MHRIAPTIAFMLLAAPSLATADPLPRELVPEPLETWIDWVLWEDGDAACTRLYGADETRCAWPSRLELRVDDRGGEFEQTWQLERESFVPLPGDTRRRPLDVRLDGDPALPHQRAGRQGVTLGAGSHTLRGRFEWGELPEAMPIPAETGLVSLEIRGEEIVFPERDEGGTIYLQKRLDPEDSTNRLATVVQRRIIDEVPLRVLTQVEIRVSGRNREELLGPALLEGLVPMSLDGPLPARLEPDGKLRVQVRPGSWTLRLLARAAGGSASLGLPEAPVWVEDEVWVFDARPALRIVDLEGAEALDPQQTRLPDEWKLLPAYRMRPGDTLRFVERRRGDSDPAPDQLDLTRRLWLDFDGGGYTIEDRIAGTLNAGWRLAMSPPTALGRVASGGHDQLITRLEGEEEGVSGVELRSPSIDIVAESRYQGSASHFPAVGWAHDFRSVDATLHLPPGWRLMHARGVDEVEDTWVNQWTLLDLFLMLILAAAVTQLWGYPAGALALITLALTLPEPQAPRWIWAYVLVAEALVRLLPDGWFAKVVRGARISGLAVLVGLALLFAVQQSLHGMYPALERSSPARGGPPPPSITSLRSAPFELAELAAESEFDMPAAGAAEQRAPRAAPKSSYQQKIGVDPDAIVQTGPGLPHWSWGRISLRWNGPVAQDHVVDLTLLGPGTNLVLSVLRILLTAALVLLTLGIRTRRGARRPVGRETVVATLFLALLVVPGAASASETGRDAASSLSSYHERSPDPELLEDLRRRLLAPPDCAPTCASIGRMRLQADPAVLTLRLEAHTQIPTAIPLPGDPKSWTPTRVLVDGVGAESMARAADGRLLLALARGRHQVILEGPLEAIDVVQIPLPMRPARVEVDARGWNVEGVHDDGLAGGDLQLTRIRGRGEGETVDLGAESLPPFVRIERSISLGLEWQVETRVSRVTPKGSAIMLSVPLLAGESVTSEGHRVEGGRVQVNLGANQSSRAWSSLLDRQSVLALRASESTEWTEIWRIDSSPLWHVELGGIPPILGPREDVAREWRPWPGEALDIRVARPEAVPGRSTTIDRSKLVVRPGSRASDATLDLTLRTSRGGVQEISLPEGARAQQVEVGGAEQPIRQQGQILSIPLKPGAQQVAIDWRAPGEIGTRYTTPSVDVGTESVNAEVEVEFPSSRWILFASRRQAGPAVLFWSFLVVAILVATVLGRIPWTPLGIRHWALLGVGMTQAELVIAMLVPAWLLVLGWRKRTPDLSPARFDLRQVAIAILTLVALVGLFESVRQGLLGRPDMQITGNGSAGSTLRWFIDRADPALPTLSIVSVPIWLYRVLMLAWALWLASALVSWLRWGWDAFQEGGLWRRLRRSS